MSDTAVKDLGQAAASAAGPRDYFALLKPRVMSLVVFTALVGMVAAVAEGASLDARLAAVALLAIAVGAGAAGALNMWHDADIDAVMARTADRPIPRGVIDRGSAGAFGLVLAALSATLLWLASNALAAALLAFTIFFYVVVYSMWLKRATPQNIVIGGAAGALPPVVAWAAASGAAPPEAWALFAIIFLWTPAHFWALALFREGDYARAGVPMMPVVRGAAATRRQIFVYAVLTAAAGLLPFAMGFGGPFYGLVAAGAGAGFGWLAWRARTNDGADLRPEKRLFGFSILYLFALFAALLAEDLAGFYV
ncbi:heme o synthase [Amphiplicatus metriothermophilus]|uniref:Protoheme IX farnesyltransferase n=1 Tax=Amphiplicatus metriothermophilus TaxID=1519374 RepID=A0A239PKZ0_9PROT|nr:heme o synthase [Amphiplicatus metriothermophilus]MBB5517943.1 protoheme IX farnesyltransferase [Amphiplicatus metriothermophilus]SNT67724.1 protoheme IX farnesyltransferase [Amphiplicatus metriothermophilus]